MSNFLALCLDLEDARCSADVDVDGMNGGAGAAAVSPRRLAVDAATVPTKDLTEVFSFLVGEATMATAARKCAGSQQPRKLCNSTLCLRFFWHV